MPDPIDDPVLLVEHDGPVTIVTLNRPKVHNALNHQVLVQLQQVLSEVELSSTTRSIVVTGAGKRAFSAGADLDELTGLDLDRAQRTLQFGQSVLTAIAQCDIPVIAAVNGLALGGGFELVLAATLAVVSDEASFGLPESGLGLIPGYGGTQRLPRLVGPSIAAHLMLSGDRLSARRAYQLGLTPLWPTEPGALMETAVGLAQKIATKGPRANAAILQALRTRAPHVEELELETTLAARLTTGREAAEGISAFKQRRSPVFIDTNED